MCGIAGTVNYPGAIMSQMMLALYERGPDYQEIYSENNISLGHTRLSILDLTPAGNQPMHTARYSLVYNGEIYNYLELKRYLDVNDDLAGGKNLTGNDARTLLLYIEKFGLTKALADSNGMFAFGLYDRQERNIYCVVDRYAQKPLYYYHEHGKFAFASTPAALTGLKNKWQIENHAVDSLFLLGSVFTDSLFSGIKKLDGSHLLVYDIDKDNVYVVKYWEEQFQENTDKIENLILDAINKVKISDVPVYIFLSGGVDSTLVASQCRGMNAIHLESPERDFAKQAADKFDIKLHDVRPDSINFANAFIDYSRKSGDASMSAFIPYVTAKETAKFAKVAITANGADELFFGYERTTQNITQKQIEHIFRASAFSPVTIGENMTLDERISRGRVLELDTYVMHDLNKTLDFASMCHSLEVRAPFLDHRLTQAALSIPEGRHFDPRYGRKAILKRMLERYGFDTRFLNRPKLGFSLHREPEGMANAKWIAWEWCKVRGYLTFDASKLTGRDHAYLQSTCLAFYYWFTVWENKLHGNY